MKQFYHDHNTLEEFVRALARATTYRSHDLGFEDSLSDYWKTEAQEWVKELDARLAPTHSVSAIRAPQCSECGFTEQHLVSCSKRITQETIARMLSGYDDATWSRLREDRKRTYRRAADSLITQWHEFKSLFEVKS